MQHSQPVPNQKNGRPGIKFCMLILSIRTVNLLVVLPLLLVVLVVVLLPLLLVVLVVVLLPTLLVVSNQVLSQRVHSSIAI